MKLRTQLLLAGAVTLLLPLVAFRTVQQMDVALRDSRAFELSKSSDSIRALLEHSGYLAQIDSGGSSDTARDLYAENIDRSIVLDGYGDDWEIQRLPERSFSFADNKATAVHSGGGLLASLGLRLAASEDTLYMLLSVQDQKVVYHQPDIPVIGSEFSAPVEQPQPGPLASGDHVSVFTTDRQGRMLETVFRAIAPGPVTGLRSANPAHAQGARPVARFRGHWAATNDGYQLEISLPLPAVNSAFGVAIVDRDDNSRQYSREAWIGTVDPQNSLQSGKLVYASREINALFAEVVAKGSRARVYDMHGRLRADLNRLYQRPGNPALLDPARTHFFNALLFRFFEWVISAQQNEADSAYPLLNPYQLDIAAPAAEIADGVRRYTSPERDQLMGRLLRIRSDDHTDMYLLHETNEDTANAFTSSAMVRMFSLVTLIGLLVAASLFAYATWLSWRIRRLSLQAKSAVGGDGRFHGRIKGSSADDEIGEMSRSFAQLVERSAGYTQYLESLASKISHELRTPLSVVQTSLENIESGDFVESDRRLLERAQGGAAQLGVLIKSMSEAARLEQTVQSSEFVRFDALAWLENARAAYSDVYQQQAFVCRFDQQTERTLLAVPELLQQALDKLVANAVDFSDAGGNILLVTTAQPGEFDLSVINYGVQLDQGRVDQLFEPMFSQRSINSGESHLGLGLYIVRLIAEAHRGRVYAKNLNSDNLNSGNLNSGTAVQIGFTVLMQ